MMKRVLKNFKEAKQVGTLYHFTSFALSIEIVKSGYLLANRSKEDLKKPSVSMTRDKFYYKRLHDGHVDIDVAFVFDGDKLSEKYKIIPYCWEWRLGSDKDLYQDFDLDINDSTSRKYIHQMKRECEERIMLPNGRLNNFKRFCKKIILIDRSSGFFTKAFRRDIIALLIGLKSRDIDDNPLVSIAKFFTGNGFKTKIIKER